jgi:thioredoxin reductase
MNVFDVVIVGGGPAGLNAAVVLGRCRRQVLLFDTGNQRNRRSHGIHNFLTRDDMLPPDFIELAKKEAKKYGVSFKNIAVTNAIKMKNGRFSITDEKGNTWYAKKILLATGLSDRLPPIEGLEELYGSSVFHCPYCDGWEVRDKNIVLYARNRNGVELALSLLTWSKSVTYLTDGRFYLKPHETELLKAHNIPVITEPVQKLQSVKGKLRNILFKNNRQYTCDAMFFVNGYTQQSKLVEQLGCTMSKQKVVLTNRLQQANIPGVYVAGDATKDMHFVVVAAAEGAKAAVNINKELQKEERKKVKPVKKSEREVALSYFD